MADSTQLDLPIIPPSAPSTPAKPRAGFGGFTRAQMIVGAALFLVLIWGIWVTKALLAPKQNHIVSVRLSELVGAYVDAQRYSGAPPEKVKVEMQTFMVSLDKELQRRSAAGDVVMVGEAVLSKNVEDITDSVRKAVFASGVPEPKPATAQQMQMLQQMSQMQAMAAGAGQAAGQGSALPPAFTPPAAGYDAAGPQLPQQQGQAYAPQPAPSAAVSTFGGPDGAGGQ